MTSTTERTEPPPGVLDEIKALFSWNPPCLTLDPNKKSSTTTRPPSFYDKHLSSAFVLKRVVRLPSLIRDLAKNVDNALDAALTTLPPLRGFITAEQRGYQLRGFEESVIDEKEVAIFYDKTTATYCSKVASTLALHPSASSSEWQSLLLWSQSDPTSHYAIPDGRLCFCSKKCIGQTDEDWAAIVESIDSEKRRIFEEMGKSKSALATWEIKNINIGTAEVMNAVRNLGTFSWTFCDDPHCDSDPNIHSTAKENVEKVSVGPDAQAPPWSFRNDALTSYVTSSATVQRPVTRQVTRSVASGSSTLPPQPNASRPSEHDTPTKCRGKKRKRDEDEDYEENDTHENEDYDADDTGEDDEDYDADDTGEDDEDYDADNADGDDGDADEPYQDRHDKTAQKLVQQAWAQAVKVDGTVIILHSGNHELVCVRHRGSQTLYVSDVIEPPACINPGYGKIHTGIYIAAIQDVMDRRWQQNLMAPNCSDLIGGDDQDDQDNTWGSGSGSKRSGKSGDAHDGGGSRGVGKRNSGGFQRSAGRKVSTDDELVAIEKTIHAASNRDVVLLYLQYDVYDSPIPASFLRSAPSIAAPTRCPTPPFSPRDIRTYGLEECLTIILTSEIGRGATGVVHHGTLKLEICDGSMPLDVVVKLAFDAEQRDALKREYEVYRRFKSKGVLQGIATVLGLFDDSEDAACALVMLCVGVPLVTEPQRILSVSDRKSTLSTLESIHRVGVLHGDIRRDNILIDDLGATIINWGHSEPCDDQEAKDKEIAQLRGLLDLASEIH